MKTLSLERVILGIILLSYLAIGTLFAVKTPYWQVPDEPAHYNYVRQVAQNGCCPAMQPGDWDEGYLNAIKAAKFSADAVGSRLESIQYEDQQPPLYYLLASIPFNVFHGDPIWLRLFSVGLGLGVILCAYGVGKVVFPAFPQVALMAAGFVAFLPQHVAMMAGINNDPLAELIVGVTLFGCACYVGNGNESSWLVREFRRPILLGLLLGLAFLTKLTIYPLAAVIGLAILIKREWVLRSLLIVFIPALLIGSTLWLRNVSTYGGLDFFAQGAHDRVVVGQLTTSAFLNGEDLTPVSPRGVGVWIRDFATTTFHSFWGQFGWMGVPMTGTIYAILGAFSIFVLLGVGISAVRFSGQLTVPQRQMILLLGITALLAVASLIYWNLKFVQFQGRYLYPGLVPVALLVACGLLGWASLVPIKPAKWIPVVMMFAFAVFDIYVLYRIILPALVAS